MKFYYVKIFILFLSLFSYSNAEIVNVFKFTDEELKNLKVRKIKKETSYTTGNNENGNFLKAVSEGTASGLGKEILINLNKTPFINITWKVEKDLNGIDEKSKKGHDYAARVFVVKKTGATALSNKAVNYVFSSNSSFFLNYRFKKIYKILINLKKNIYSGNMKLLLI